jgi:hypothetical protein
MESYKNAIFGPFGLPNRPIYLASSIKAAFQVAYGYGVRWQAKRDTALLLAERIG